MTFRPDSNRTPKPAWRILAGLVAAIIFASTGYHLLLGTKQGFWNTLAVASLLSFMAFLLLWMRTLLRTTRPTSRSYDLSTLSGTSAPTIRRSSPSVPIIKDYPFTETTAECRQNLKTLRSLT